MAAQDSLNNGSGITLAKTASENENKALNLVLADG